VSAVGHSEVEGQAGIGGLDADTHGWVVN